MISWIKFCCCCCCCCCCSKASAVDLYRLNVLRGTTTAFFNPKRCDKHPCPSFLYECLPLGKRRHSFYYSGRKCPSCIYLNVYQPVTASILYNVMKSVFRLWAYTEREIERRTHHLNWIFVWRRPANTAIRQHFILNSLKYEVG